jgi:hypothetical protein
MGLSYFDPTLLLRGAAMGLSKTASGWRGGRKRLAGRGEARGVI